MKMMNSRYFYNDNKSLYTFREEVKATDPSRELYLLILRVPVPKHILKDVIETTLYSNAIMMLTKDELKRSFTYGKYYKVKLDTNMVRKHIYYIPVSQDFAYDDLSLGWVDGDMHNHANITAEFNDNIKKLTVDTATFFNDTQQIVYTILNIKKDNDIAKETLDPYKYIFFFDLTKTNLDPDS